MSSAGFNSDETKPLTKADARALRQANRELDALRAWVRAGGDERRAAEALDMEQGKARVLIRRGMRRYYKERIDDLDGLRARQLVEMEMMREPTLGRAVDGNSQALNDMIRLMERESKLLGLDAQRERDGGPQIIVVDSRMPWDRDDGPPTVDGDVIDVPALEPPSDTDGGETRTHEEDET